MNIVFCFILLYQKTNMYVTRIWPADDKFTRQQTIDEIKIDENELDTIHINKQHKKSSL